MTRWILTGLLLAPLASLHAAEPAAKPNIILAMADDMGWGDPGFNGNKVIKTPHLDEMAQAGLRFERFYSGGPVCSPTRGSCLTGRHPYRYGIWTANAGHLREEEISLAEALKTQGYTTGHFGKWHLGTLDPTRSGKGASRNPRRNYLTPGMKGFDEWFSTEYAVRTWDPGKDNSANPYYHNGKIETENLQGCDSRVLMDRALTFIRKAAGAKTPFLAVIWFHAPHEPVAAGPEFLRMYSDRDTGEQNYYGVITALDVQIGRLRRELRDLGIADNTMLWFASDNGPEGDTGDKGTTRGSAGPLRGRKRSLWEGGIRVPGLLEWPARIKPGTATAIPCSTLDYFPTTLEILGFTMKGQPQPLDGVSLVPLFEGRMTERPVPIPLETPGGTGSTASRGSPRMALVDNHYKVLTDMGDMESADLLFDLRADPGETTNLAVQQPEIIRSMKATLAGFRESCKRSLAGKDYAVPFTPDKDDVHPSERSAAPKKRRTDAGGQPERPNILLILADDLGWSDLGCYGSEIRTPHLDSLARGGLRFTQFYNSARCSPTRAAILTGLHPHQAGFPNLSGVLPAHCVTIPEVLRPAGYRTYMVGKWHLSRQSTPTQRGFDEFYGMIGGYNSCWQEDPFYTRLPDGRPKRTYAPGAFYSTDVFGDYALDFLGDARQSGRPWLLYLAFNAAHFPLHAWEEDIAKYETLYAQGWDRIREQRLARQKELGLVPGDLKLTPRSNIPENRFNAQTGWADQDNPAWDSLPADRRADLARRMAVYAAMVDRMDQAIGRIVARLKETGQFDNTVIFFLSDNGACAEWDPWGFDEVSGPKNVLHVGADLKKVGGPDSYVSYGSAWANACNTPFRLYKHYGHEGGINTPLIVHWPAGLKTKAGTITREAGHIIDFLPTVLELAGASYPQEREGQKVLPPEGVSLAAVLKGGRLSPRPIFMEHEGNRAVHEGCWKLVALKDKPWELYDIEADPTEMSDLAAREPDRVARLAQTWEDWADRCSVRGQPSTSPQIANRPLAITCEVEPQSRDGVILAHGGNQQGYALWLREGQLVFGVRLNGKLTSITAGELPSGRFAIAARLHRDGRMQLVVNGRTVADGQASGLIPAQPVDELSIGQDAHTAVGNYVAPHALRGKVEKVRVVAQ